MGKPSEERIQLKKTIRSQFVIAALKEISTEMGVSPQQALYLLGIERMKQLKGMPITPYKTK